MTGVLVRDCGLFVSIDLDEYHVTGISAIAQHIESQDPRLVATRMSVFLSRSEEPLDLIGNDRNVNMDN